MKKAARITILLLAVLCGLIAAFEAFGPLTYKTQNAKNLLVLADMKDRVRAIRVFQGQNERLPSNEELAGLSSALPVRYGRYDYNIETSKMSYDSDYPQNWPATGGWVLSFWRGEWWEYYSSWDDRYTIPAQLTAWDGYGTLLAYAIGLVLLSRAGFLQDRKNQLPNKRATDNSGADCGRWTN